MAPRKKKGEVTEKIQGVDTQKKVEPPETEGDLCVTNNKPQNNVIAGPAMNHK